MLNRVSSISIIFPEQMGAAAPIEVGTQGTVGTLVKKEIEYFRSLEFDHSGRSSLKPKKDMGGSNRGNLWPCFGFFTMTWKKKNRRSSGILPGVCSRVEVVESRRFNYRNLKDDAHC